MGRPKSAIGYHQFASKAAMAAAVIEAQQNRWGEIEASLDQPHGLERVTALLLATSLDARSCPVAAGATRLLHELRRQDFEVPRGFDWNRVLDDELRDGPDPSNSSLVGRFQGIVAFAGLVSPPGMQSAITFVFTAGKHGGSTLAMLGTVQSFESAFERAVVGGTGAFRMARGYCVMNAVSNPALESVVYEVNLFVKMDA
jgi:AcrR family transcriptional regulator